MRAENLKKNDMKCSNYGDVLAAGLQMKLLAYEEFGSYQGDYIAILQDGERIKIFKGRYGSCSGCDWLHGERNWDTDEIEDEKIVDYVKDDKPFLELDRAKVEVIVNSDDPAAYFPANTREDYDDWNWNDIKRLMQEALDPSKPL